MKTCKPNKNLHNKDDLNVNKCCFRFTTCQIVSCLGKEKARNMSGGVKK